MHFPKANSLEFFSKNKGGLIYTKNKISTTATTSSKPADCFFFADYDLNKPPLDLLIIRFMIR